MALLFAVLSWPLGSVGWLFCCAGTVVTVILAAIFSVIALTGERRFRGRGLTGLFLAILAAVLLYLSYRHVSAADRL